MVLDYARIPACGLPEMKCWIQRNWRALLLRTALLEAFWFLLALVVAMEFHFMAQHGPIKISWAQTAQSALRDWFPWMLFSPAVVGLAGLFRFDRVTWRRSVLVHLVACAISVVMYEALLELTFPKPSQLTFGGGPPGLPPGDAIGVVGIGRLAGQPDRLAPAPPDLSPSNGALALGGINSTGGHFMAGVRIPDKGADSPFIVSLARGLPLPGGVAVADPAGHGTGRLVAFAPAGNLGPGLPSRALFRIQFTAPIYWCIVCACWVLSHWQESHERERRSLELEARLTEANLRALKMQMQPHFLFNTLNAISSLIHESPKAADDMVGSLSQLLRMNLDASSENEVPLQRELEFVDRYLEIQRARFGNRLRIYREIDGPAREAMVPPLILQPLVENSIRHGIEARESGGSLSIRARRRGEMLCLEISDDGNGFSDGGVLRCSEGIGLSNTKARLAALYGGRHQFRLTARQPAGACASIEIPFRPIASPAESQT
jgi:two-component sensor histidine kinase